MVKGIAFLAKMVLSLVAPDHTSIMVEQDDSCRIRINDMPRFASSRLGARQRFDHRTRILVRSFECSDEFRRSSRWSGRFE